MKVGKEGAGVLFTIISAALWGFFLIVIHHWSLQIPKFFFAAATGLFAALSTAFWAFGRGKLNELKKREAYPSLIMVGICVVFLPNLLLFWGATLTSALNTSILMLSEMIFTLIFTPLFGERNTLEKYVGSVGIFIGAAMVLYKGGGFDFNIGDLMIVLSTVSFPIGNFYSKRALYIVSPSIVIMARYLIGGVLLLIVSLCFEPVASIGASLQSHWLLLILSGFILLAICKIAFYEGMKRLDISKVISLEMTYPFFSLLALIFFFGEQISILQLLGVSIMVVGAFFAVKRKSVDAVGKYHPKVK